MSQDIVEIEKACTKCGVVKPLSEFGNKKRNRSGKGPRCLECQRAILREYQKLPEVRVAEAISQRQRYWKNRDEAKGRRGAYRQTHATRYERDPVKEAVRQELHKALRKGDLVRPETCQDCGGTGPIHGHHPDYAKPLDVEWLCSACHGARHRKYADTGAVLSMGGANGQ